MSTDGKHEIAHAELAEHDIVQGKVSKKGIVLRPQPTNDPNEPLNWNQFEKYTTYVVCCFFTFLAFMNSSAFTVAIKPIIMEFKKTSTQASYLTSLQVLGMGFGALFLMPMTRIIGKRPVYLISLLCLCITNVWSYFSHSYGSLLASRIVGGLMTAAADALVPSLVADLFYFHERGHALMIFHFAISAGAFGGPFINAYITQYAGWRWICGVMAILAGATFVMGLVLIRETVYIVDGARDLEKPEDEYAPKRGWAAGLSLRRGFNPRESFFGWVLRTISLIAYPPVWIAGLTVGLFIGCNIAIQITSTQTFTAAPYHWQLHTLGLLSLAGLVGAMISFVFGGWLIDFIATKMTARNAEHVEPEYRLIAMIIPAIIGPMGVLTFGLVIAEGKSWGGAAIGYGMEGFGATAASNIIITYAVDAYRPIAGETIVIVFVIRNAIACLISTYISAWFQHQGLRRAYGELVGVGYIILSLSLVLYFFGHRIRRFTSSFGPMSKIGHG
ncbi:major facilitator superfamily domain-containing protein [Lophiotrema nucula]|uniref:Major facilitator superfamily domain-containing protein n=1 Tax=Lophiotrema nucula TaxID=690887 RepID=A0A6A5ZB71_9PLEO|nr:major facilitator superfamily domain-containing protein [Lophiotrema nucula]